jgi:hypothetical protein
MHRFQENPRKTLTTFALAVVGPIGGGVGIYSANGHEIGYAIGGALTLAIGVCGIGLQTCRTPATEVINIQNFTNTPLISDVLQVETPGERLGQLRLLDQIERRQPQPNQEMLVLVLALIERYEGQTATVIGRPMSVLSEEELLSNLRSLQQNLELEPRKD